MKRKLFTLMLLTFGAVISNIYGAYVYDFTISGIYYKIVSGGVEVCEAPHSYDYYGAITIPSTVTYSGNRYNVIGIYEYAFASSDISSVYLPETIKRIGANAFANSFSLVRVNIPNSVTAIEEETFLNCEQLSSIALPDGIKYIGNSAFYGCSALTQITIPKNCSSISEEAFYNCNLNKITWNAIACEVNSAFSSNGTITSIIFDDDVTYIPSGLCENFSGLRQVTIPNKVVEIGSETFYNCVNLINVTIGENVTSIGKNAFANTAIMSINLSQQISDIMTGAFDGCKNLAEIIFGEKVSNIGVNAFRSCPISTIYAEGSTPVIIDNSVFSGVDNYYSITLYVHKSDINNYSTANIWKEMNIKSIESIGLLELVVSPNSVFEGICSGNGTYEMDTEALISAYPKDGYHFTKWNDGNTDNPRLVKVTGDLTFTAYFAEGSAGTPTPSGNAYQVNISGENCSMNISSQYPEGSVVTMQAVPDECLEFKQWSDGNKNNPRTITVTANGNYKAEFNKITYTITGKSDQQNGKVNIVVK